MVRAGRRLPVLREPDHPKTRSDCEDGPRPCPWVGCRYHLFLSVHPNTGRIYINGIASEHDEDSIVFLLKSMKETCTLDVADRQEPMTLEAIAELMGDHRANIIRTEQAALDKARVLVSDEHPDDPYFRMMFEQETKNK